MTVTQPRDCSAEIQARLEQVLKRVSRHAMSCPLCYRAEIVAQVARENPGWSQLRVNLYVDDLLSAPAWRVG